VAVHPAGVPESSGCACSPPWLLVTSGVSEEPKLLPLEFGPDATFWLDEDGRPVASEGGKAWVAGSKFKVESAEPPLIGEEPFVTRLSREEFLREAALCELR